MNSRLSSVCSAYTTSLLFFMPWKRTLEALYTIPEDEDENEVNPYPIHDPAAWIRELDIRVLVFFPERLPEFWLVLQHTARIEALKAERTPGKGGKTCISALRQPTCVIEFLRLEAKHCAATAPEDWHPQLTVGGETLPRDTLAFPTRASFTGEDWPEEFARPVQATRQADGDDEDDDEEELTQYEQIQRTIVNARLSLHAASADGESQPRERRAGAGTHSQRPP